MIVRHTIFGARFIAVSYTHLWKYYKGGMADDIWMYNPEKKSVENITNNEAQDIFPIWIGDEIYFLSDRDYTMRCV